ncbi:hypothetical protein GA0074692_0481 [Micromonospora pallida]|uniref:V8-like Glu-specific endopeptidase n=1 Tax=Micromonospora pallida TaxID=145854 RepID=A0A1C6RNX6_9ACTN|nr:hypothetical protein [Micromonospora pallida]SCL18815.1 hypothetical protein GA0074692_0481 [Micromonospora pallida]
MKSFRQFVIVCTVVGAALATGAVAYASPAAGTFSVGERARAVAHWTPERMRAAVPLESLAHAGKSASPASSGPATSGPATSGPASGRPVSASATVPASFPHPGGPWPGGGSVSRTVGRVFAITHDNRDVWCTATAVTSVNKSTTMTAAHCVRYGGFYLARWVFAPGYHQGVAPYGLWPARRIMAMDNSGGSPNPVYDVGAGIVAPLNGRYLTDVVGGEGITFNEPVIRDRYAFGYVVSAPYYGNWLAYCSGTTSSDPYGNPTLACTMGTGAGGGPWFVRFDEATGSGLLNSVTAVGSTTSRLVGAYFGELARTFYLTAQSS